MNFSLHFGVALAGCLLFCIPANGAAIFLLDKSKPSMGSTEHVFMRPVTPGGAPELLGTIGHDPDTRVKFYDTGTNMRQQGRGHAWIKPVEGTFHDMKIAAHGDTESFLAMELNLHAAGNGSVTLTMHGPGGGQLQGLDAHDQSSETFRIRKNGQNRLRVIADADEEFFELEINSTAPLESVRQVRVDPIVIPEPLGLPILGAVSVLMMRRRRASR